MILSKSFVKSFEIDCFRGDENDVLDRFYLASLEYSPEHIVRLTGDCPLHDAELIDNLIVAYLNGDYDYGSNVYPHSFPDGLDIEIFKFETLKYMWEKAKLKSEREHVTSYLYNHMEEFKIYSYISEKDLSDFRLTLDEEHDLDLIRKILNHFGENNLLFSMQEMLQYLEKNPDLLKINAHINRNEGYQKSLLND